MRCFPIQLWVVAVAALLPSVATADDASLDCRPQHARVVAAGASVRSGAGESHYLCDTLAEGAVVEVYRRQPDGWCAIRPPMGSFSWVFAQHVERVSDNLARVNKEDVPARVGSRLSAQRDVVHVRLRKGETVRILGNDDRDGETWCKIAPPAGEFRWIHASDLGLGSSGGTGTEQAADDNSVITVSFDQPADASSGGSATEVEPPARTTNEGQAATPKMPAADDVTPVTPQASSADLAQQLNNLELRLSRMVAEPTATWNVSALEQTAEQLLARAETVADREAVKALLSKIDRFASIHRRYLSLAGGAAPGIPPGATAAAVVPSPAVGGAAAQLAPGQYDAVGILRPVVSRRPGAPQFALVNEQGQVVSFVTPTPDVNLQPYVGRPVGVVGSRGYIPEFRRAHVTAGRVMPLEGRTLR